MKHFRDVMNTKINSSCKNFLKKKILENLNSIHSLKMGIVDFQITDYGVQIVVILFILKQEIY
jgi:hypothetical protein